ncbi:hypothetical protein FHS61_003003 [Altererythrobacter atlanticus]|uniref:hypothetical protein n=1 Tax=Croceibacterium atlanticum TaxID=1267766 RepID=UPI000A958B87|nr:hypothetical protein [Croceibacterium atlanticum]MBB5733956.1 hypothetical protein [Croceibacterium atlanticum]
MEYSLSGGILARPFLISAISMHRKVRFAKSPSRDRGDAPEQPQMRFNLTKGILM